jgi:aminoglycoside 6-adenylyltransferase
VLTPPDEAQVLDRLVCWGSAEANVRALLLDSSRAVDGAPLDRLSDYDIVVVVSATAPFVADETWLRAYGMPLVQFRDTSSTLGLTTYHRLALYEDHTKIDYSLWPVEVPRASAERRALPEDLDWGYRVLLDKDGLTTDLPAPTHTAHIPPRPSESEYQALVEEFWWESTYAAKHLWRDELMHARYNLDVVMRHALLGRMLEWRVELDHDWSLRPGVAGRGLKRHLPADLWAELEATFAGPGSEENWRALFAMTALFRRVAFDVATALSYQYPTVLDRRVTAYLEEVRRLPAPGAAT